MRKKIPKSILQSLELQTEQMSLPNKSLNGPILALDYGEKHCGLAWSPDGMVVFPLAVVSHGELRSQLRKFSAEKFTKRLIIGLPVSDEGTENHICQQIRDFADSVSGEFTVALVNERASTKSTFSSDENRKDDLAAAQILEYWLQQK